MGEAAHRRWSDGQGAEPPSPTKAWYPSGCLGNTCVQVSTIRAPPQTCLSGICSSTGSRRSPRQHDAQEGPRLPRAEEKDAPIRSAFPRLTVEKNEKDTRAAQMKELLRKETQDSPTLQGQPRPAGTAPPCKDSPHPPCGKPTARCPRMERDSPGAAIVAPTGFSGA